MTIEYDEEVKLHDGEMIWVHITRHYGMVGGVSSGHGKSYMPGNVEISWDTGFEGVGRKSVYFSRQVFLIDKFNGIWYIAGAKNNNSSKKLNDSVNCNTVGFFIGDNGCIVALNNEEEYIIDEPTILDGEKINILYSIGINDWGSVPQALDGKKLSWNDKIILQASQEKDNQYIGKAW